MSAFAKKQMEKMGWKEGEGLGKNKDGITTFVRVQKRDPTLQSGLGHEASKRGADNSDMGLDALLSTMAKKDERKKKESKRPREEESDDDDHHHHQDAVVKTKKDGENSSAATPLAEAKQDHQLQRRRRGAQEKEEEEEASSSSSSSSDDENDEADSKQLPGDILKWNDKQLLERCGGVRLGRAGRHRFFNGKLARIDESHK